MDYRFKINEIQIANGELPPIKYVPKQLNIIIGANSSGKSKLLREIRDTIYPRQDRLSQEKKVICNSIDLDSPTSFEEFDRAYHLSRRMVKTVNGYRNIDYCSTGIVFDQEGRVQGPDQYVPSICIDNDWGSYAAALYDGNVDASRGERLAELLEYAGASLVTYSAPIDRALMAYGERKFGRIDAQTNFLSSIQFHDDVLEELSETCKKLFRKDVCLDRESSQLLKFRVGRDFSKYWESSKKTSEYNELLYQANLLDNEGDGLKGFVITFLTLKSGNRPIILIDEPEAFLHPVQAYQLGAIIGQSITPDCQIFIATHSSDLIRGVMAIVEKKNFESIGLLRLNGQAEAAAGNAAKIVEGALLHNIASNKRFSKSSAIDGLFAKSMILVEDDSDRLVYQALLDKLGIMEDCPIIPIFGKDLAHPHIELFTSMGIPCRAILDFDLVNNWEKLKLILRALKIDAGKQGLHLLIKKMQEEAKRCHPVSESDEKDSRGAEDRSRKSDEWKQEYKSVSTEWPTCSPSFQRLVDQFEEYRQLFISHGLLIVGTGELETVLEDGPYSSQNKDKWLWRALEMIDEMGETDLQALSIVCDMKKMFFAI